MARIDWLSSYKQIEAGLDRGVLYVEGENGVAWNGLVAVDETVLGGSVTPFHLDGVRYHNDGEREDFAGTIEAYNYPPEFEVCDGSVELEPGMSGKEQPRKRFHLAYRTLVGTGTNPREGYKIHLVFNMTLAPAALDRRTLGDQIDPLNFSWSFTAVPVKLEGLRPTAHVVIDSRKVKAETLLELESILYGTVSTQPRFPTIEELDELRAFRVIDNGDGTFTILGSDEAVDPGYGVTGELTWPSVRPDGDTARISSS